ncbi:hypothetical protein EPI10_015465 [Gossypium australe]|uniref:Uncharacterized protein n=1 Tax=Gossypium australe TaxID=47621 RepID=A0A5B6VL17_9ROSI|nr:hypothetical protein EPI10_015465 [Gossypium australe]
MKATELTCVIMGKIMFLMNAHQTQPQYITWEISIGNIIHIPIRIIQGGKNIPTSIGVIKVWEIPVVLLDRMSLVHQLDIINSCHNKICIPKSLGKLSSADCQFIKFETLRSIVKSQRKKHYKAVTLRSGTQLPGVVNDDTDEDDNSDFTHGMNSEPFIVQFTTEKRK